jgi:predicted nucleic acid-binding protein
MIVLDASAAVDWLLQTPSGQRIENRIYSRNETLHAPHLLDLEVPQVLRRLARQGVIPVRRADEAVRDLLDLRITRYPHFVLLPRIWQLRHHFSAYDAAYIVLAEKLGAVSYTGRSTRFCFGPCGAHRAVLIRRTAFYSLTYCSYIISARQN